MGEVLVQVSQRRVDRHLPEQTDTHSSGYEMRSVRIQTDATRWQCVHIYAHQLQTKQS